jgi:hypothetical protein
VPQYHPRNVAEDETRIVELSPTAEDIATTFPCLAADGKRQSISRELSPLVRQCDWCRFRDLRRHLRRRAEHREELQQEKQGDVLRPTLLARRCDTIPRDGFSVPLMGH